MVLQWLQPVFEWFGGTPTTFFLALLCVIGLILIVKRG